MRYDFDRIIDRRLGRSFKWSAFPDDVLPLFIADMDFESPPAVKDALRAVVDHGVFGYPTGLQHDGSLAAPALQELIVQRLAARYGWRIAPEAVVVGAGLVVGFNVACQLFRGQGAVLVQPPIYTPMLMAPGWADLARQDAPLMPQADGTYAIDFDRFATAITPETRLFLMCNPHNPVGRVFRRDELERLAELCLARDLIICADEIHSELIYRGQRHIPIASLSPEIERRTITLIAPTKTFNLPGLHCSIAIIPDEELRRRYIAARQGLVMWLNLMGLVAAEAAYRHGDEWLDQLLIYLEANRDFAVDFIRSEMPAIKIAKPQGTYLAWLDCRAAIAGNPFQFFLEQAKVALSDGATYGPGGEGFVRLNFGCPRATLAEALQRMKRALETPTAGRAEITGGAS